MAALHGVEETNFDPGMAAQGRNACVSSHERDVIHHEADTHTAVGGLEHPLEQQVGGGIVVPQVVLHVEGFFRQIGEQ